MNLIPLGTRPANPVRVRDTDPAIIPTAFARYHAAIASCGTIAELTDVAMRIAPDPDQLSVEAQRELFELANRRFTELRAKEQAA